VGFAWLYCGGVILGFLIDAFGIKSLLWFLLAVQITLYTLTFKLPEAVVASHAHDQFSVWQIVRQPAVIGLLVGCSLMVTAHGVLYNFYSIYLAEHGYSKTMIGFCGPSASFVKLVCLC